MYEHKTLKMSSFVFHRRRKIAYWFWKTTGWINVDRFYFWVTQPFNAFIGWCCAAAVQRWRNPFKASVTVMKLIFHDSSTCILPLDTVWSPAQARCLLRPPLIFCRVLEPHASQHLDTLRPLSGELGLLSVTQPPTGLAQSTGNIQTLIWWVDLKAISIYCL